MNTTTPKEKIYRLIREIYTEFTPLEIAEAIAQVRKEIEDKKREYELKAQLDKQNQINNLPSLYP